MTLRIAIPVFFSTVRLHVEKGRQWNAIEHILLYAVCKNAMTGSQLAAESGAPLRLAIEIMIRLMRAGWVELESNPVGYRFRGSVVGKMVAERDTLPAITRPETRRASYVIERITGSVFREKDLTLYNKHTLDKLMQVGQVGSMKAQNIEGLIRQDAIIAELREEDEEIKDIDALPSRYTERYALVSIAGSAIEGLPAKATLTLRKQILGAAGSLSRINNVANLGALESNRVVVPYSLSAKIDFANLIIGGKQHLHLLTSLLKRARKRIVIHSTFVHLGNFKSILLPMFQDAARRGVKIDLFWGKADNQDGSNSISATIDACKDLITADDLRERITIHNHSTSSHAKLVVADDGRGSYRCIVGSCNWLSTDFKGIEASILFDDSRVVAEIVAILGCMAAGPHLDWTSLSAELGILAQSLRQVDTDVTDHNAEIELVLGGRHNHYTLRSRDEAKERILVTSDRFSENAGTLILKPLQAALADRALDVRLYFAQYDGAGGGGTAITLQESEIGKGIQFNYLENSRLHAKVLAWDNDHAVVSSQNWLSADPPDDGSFSEIGVYINSPNIASEIAKRLSLSQKPQKANQGELDI